MVTAVCSSSPREIENRIEADHPVVSVAALFSSLCRIKMPTVTKLANTSMQISKCIKSVKAFSAEQSAEILPVPWFRLVPTFSLHIFFLLSLYLLLLCGSMTPQPAPASAGEESEEDQQFRTIFQEIAGDVSCFFLSKQRVLILCGEF